MLALLTLLAGLVHGAFAQDDASFEAALRVLAQRYPDEVSSGAFYKAAIAGLATHVDELNQGSGSALLTKADVEDERARERGEREGIGVEFWVLAGQGMVINRVFEGSQAEAAHLQVGDLIVAVNDQPLTGRSRDAILSILGMAHGPSVVLDVRRKDAPPRTYRVPWGTWFLKPVERCPNLEVPCLELQHFGTGTASALEASIKGLDPKKGLILDLRGNDDGLIDEMVASADLFLEAGQVVTLRDVPGEPSEVLRARTPAAWAGKLVIVMDETTSGLAEAFAAALREQVRAQVVGTASGGVGTTVSLHPLGDDLVLRLADVHLRSPAGRSWAPRGLAPDVTVEHPDVLLPPGGVYALPDLQLEAAIRLLRAP